MSQPLHDSLRTRIRSSLFVTLGQTIQTLAGRNRLLTRGKRSNKIALTFDDGPEPLATPRVMSVLDEHDSKGTFFCVGEHARKHSTLLRDLHAAGHEVGSHTHTHISLPKLPWKMAIEEIRNGRKALEDVLGQSCPLFRPPFGLMTPQLLPGVWREGITIVLWTFSTRDYSEYPVEQLEQRMMHRRIKSGDVVLLHDTTESAPRLTRKLCEMACQNELQATTISGLLTPEARKTVTS